MNLVIVESPSKAKTINKYLGKNYKVIASYGHIRQLPSKNGSVNPDENFSIIWEETIQAKKYIKDIIKNVKEAENIYLATDPDREGEAISWHLLSYLKEKKAISNKTPIKRVVFNSITKENIINAFNNARDIDDNLVSAYLARLSLDYLVGFGISPILWRKMPGSRSAGRVQSVALKIICERENEIEDFKPIEYWTLITNLIYDAKNQLSAKLHKLDNITYDKLAIKNIEEAENIKKRILASKFYLDSIEKKKLAKNPFAPFTTSTLQQDAFNKLGFSTKKTMQIAQKLYEGVQLHNDTQGLITYMRTDATQIDPNFINQIRTHIKKEYGEKYLSQSLRIYKTKAKNAQEAHEAIRPTNIENSPDKIKKYLEEDAFKLYSLIWQRAIASQMESANYDLSVFEIVSHQKDICLRVTGSILKFDGFYKIYRNEKSQQESSDDDDENKSLPNLPINTEFIPKDVETSQHFTEPPARYSEATLVKKLEEMGIGRPSTYASIISVLQDRKYTKLEKKRFIPEARGRILNIFLNNYFSQYVEYGFTAELEAKLDSISNGTSEWKDILLDFWKDFSKTTKIVSEIKVPEIMDLINKVALKHFVKEETKCPKCLKGDLQIKNSKFGAFIGCSLYPECTYTHQLESFNDEEIEHNKEHKPADANILLGKDENNYSIFLKKGPYGFYLEKTSPTPKRTAVPKTLDASNITLEQALFLLSLPKKLDETITFSIGKFGPYLQENKIFYSYKGNIFDITLDLAKKIIATEKKKKVGEVLGVHPKSKLEISLKNGRFGLYLYYNGKNVKIPKEYKTDNISLDEAIKIIDNT